MSTKSYDTQNQLLLNNLLAFYNENENMTKMLNIINGVSPISLRIIDWFATNFSKKYYTVYDLENKKRFKVYDDYKLKLKAYSKRRFDPFCRWERITIPYKNGGIQTTIGQLNFFKWALENEVINYIEKNYAIIEKDMNSRNSTTKNKAILNDNNSKNKTRKKREELSVSASKSIKKEKVEITINFKEI